MIGDWGRPEGPVAWAALGVAIVLGALVAVGRGRAIFAEEVLPHRHFLRLSAFAAAMLSLVWISAYLRGGPRIIDATTYFLQGRALAEGDLAWPLPEPSASFRGRFLIAQDGHLGGIFPPGYPLLLAAGFMVGAPMIIGPLLAAAIVVATFLLTRAIAEDAGLGSRAEPIARLAALVSTVCAALRYHTADTMSHGATALGVTIALTAALRGRPALTGLAIGYVIATRPVSALPIGIVASVLLARRETAGARRDLALAAAGLVPGILLLLASQQAVTGSWLVSTQRMYYTLSDGPPGCFRWGFGQGAGCLGEHGEFVRVRLPEGHGLVSAVSATARRLKMHLMDVASFEPLALLVLVPVGKTRSRATIAASALVGLQVLAYAPFYFDGNYPGGGARFFADVLPVEHALVALAIALVFRTPIAFARGAHALLGISLAGFAVHAAFEHRRLAERDGGRPMFEPDLLAQHGAREGLVYVDTDHGFAIGHDPGARTKDGVVVARLRGDDRDRLLFDRLDHPPTWLYRFGNPPVLVPWAPPELSMPLRFEAEAEWPPLGQEGGFALPAQVDGCASNSRALVLTPTAASGQMHASVAVPVPEKARYRVGLHVVLGSIAPFTEHLTEGGSGAGGARLGTARWTWPAGGRGCLALPIGSAELEPPSARLELEAKGGPVAVDRITLERD